MDYSILCDILMELEIIKYGILKSKTNVFFEKPKICISVKISYLFFCISKEMVTKIQILSTE